MVKSEENVISNLNELKNVFQRKDKNSYYEDDDLKTPGHDKIVGQLINNEMLSKIANILSGKVIFDENDKWIKKEEFPIKIGYNFRYIDVCAILNKTFYFEYCFYYCKENGNYGNCSYKRIHKKFVDEECYDNEKCVHKDNLKECSLCDIRKTSDTTTIKINIEVKTKIISIGELIRQINTYRELNNGIYLVITPNVTEELRNRLNNSEISLIDTKQLNIII